MRHLQFAMVAAGLAALGIGLNAGTSAQQTRPRPGQPENRDMELVGYNDLQARSAYQPVIRKQGDRWIAYIGHHGGAALNPLTGQRESNGTSIVDVTNPKLPKYLAHIPGESGEGEGGGAQMVRVCDGSQLPRADKSKVYLLRTYGNHGHEVWDVANPSKPARVSVVVSGLRATHKNWWECDTGIAYLVSGPPGWRTDRMTQIYDLSDPAKPVFIRDFGLPGQQPGGTGPPPTGLHGAISMGPNGNRVYFGYGTAAGGVVQIVDREKLLKGPPEPTSQNLLYPQIGRLDLPPNVGAHTVFPVLRVEVPEFGRQAESGVRDFVVITNESTANECREARQMVWIADITTESKPFGVSNWTVPEASGNFCGRGGRFGTHSSNENMTLIYYKRVMFFAHFNAGVRAVDIRDPFNPKEIAFYIPATTDNTDKRCVDPGPNQRCKIAIQTNNVEVDDRGYIYIVDRANTGMHILELTGAARRVANLP
jgi:hypothetical protein